MAALEFEKGIKELSTLCVGPKNYQVYGSPVRDY